ncbi:MAG: hypothetical protein ACQKBV_12980 [Puniceicoccales bacterium]
MFPKTSFWATLCAALLFATACLAQGTNLEVNRILREHRQALGNPAQLQAVNSMRLSGVSEQDGQTFRFLLNQRDSGQIRYELEADGRKVIQVFDGSNGWRWIEGEPEFGATRLNAGQLRFFRIFQSFQPILQDYLRYGFQVEYLGEHTFAGEPSVGEHHLRLTSEEHGDVVDVWLSVRAMLETRRAYRPAADATPLEFHFTDYRYVDGLLVPHRVSVQLENEVIASTVIDKAVTNVGLLSFYFTKPSSFREVAPE